MTEEVRLHIQKGEIESLEEAFSYVITNVDTRFKNAGYVDIQLSQYGELTEEDVEPVLSKFWAVQISGIVEGTDEHERRVIEDVFGN